jgi:hypothetical protein
MPDTHEAVWNWAETKTEAEASPHRGQHGKATGFVSGEPDAGYVLTWGKHKGRAIKDVPADYLVWCLDNMDWLAPGEPKFNRTLWEIVRRRLNLPTDLPKQESLSAYEPKMPPGKPSEHLRRAIKQWYASMSRRFHPDLGGSVKEMVVVNLCHDTLIELLEGLETKK